MAELCCFTCAAAVCVIVIPVAILTRLLTLEHPTVLSGDSRGCEVHPWAPSTVRKKPLFRMRSRNVFQETQEDMENHLAALQ